MTFAKPLFAAAASIGIIAAPVAAQSAPTRAPSNAAESDQFAGSTLLYVLLAAAAVGVYLIVSDDDEDAPTSP